jgi:catechol 2,3-dioxygenase-like lactoylglutathione lyase family enzyme
MDSAALYGSLLPFMPSGSDYQASRRLFADLGFEEVWENNGYAGFRNGGAEFILQGREVTMIDLAGVCWHIGQRGD